MNRTRLLKTRLEPPYKTDNKTTNFPLRNRPGCYLIYKNDVLRYVGYAGKDVYTTMYRHFQNWKDRSQHRNTYDRASCKVRMIYTTTAKQAENLETALIIKYKPRDNGNKLQTILNFQQKDILTEYVDINTALNSEYKEAWE
jgi:hypothetical protein